MTEMEKDHIMQALETCHWRIEGRNGAAELLGLNPGTLRGRMRKYGIKNRRTGRKRRKKVFELTTCFPYHIIHL